MAALGAQQKGPWSGSKFIVWGGMLTTGSTSNTGALYDPQLDSWTTMSTTSYPAVAGSGTWTGGKLLLWGGDLGLSRTNTGAIYTP